ncbi:phospholipase D-like domain-containing protein [Planococcus ruber]|uniref:phospholipase D-like domain-containing protein n=1 Tax=Planococcus ruber TaxID=2027871 RepID=UPI001FEE6826|nr:phospholipase D-like domain-containing protein [Planococcus ruber]MCJ1909966.1 phospholipase D-like domain-containing protein [Planococcus ruber]
MFNKESLLNFIEFVERYKLKDHLQYIFESLRFTSALHKSFSLPNFDYVIGLNVNLQKELNYTILNLFTELQVLSFNDKYTLNSVRLDALYKFLKVYFEADLINQNTTSNNLLWNLNFQFKNHLSLDLRNDFSDLTTHLKNIISTAQKKIIFCAPYFSIAGLEILLPSIKVSLNKNPDLTIIFIIESEANESNKIFLNEIEKRLEKNSYEIYIPVDKIDEGLMLHSKFLLADNKKGYLGSANFSERALRQQFEVGIKLSVSESKSLAKLVDSWIKLDYLQKLR